MKNLLSLLFVVVATLSTVQEAKAQSLGDIIFGRRGPIITRPAPLPGRGIVQCRAYDRGHEEHWGGHSSCRSCTQEHGRCVERCTSSVAHCTASGVDRAGYSQSFSATAGREIVARDMALNRCYRFGAASCRIVSCRRDNRVESVRDCRSYRRGPRDPRRPDPRHPRPRRPRRGR